MDYTWGTRCWNLSGVWSWLDAMGNVWDSAVAKDPQGMSPAVSQAVHAFVGCRAEYSILYGLVETKAFLGRSDISSLVSSTRKGL